ncbi:unnamed protein product [Cunninghamella blakesleeana]
MINTLTVDIVAILLKDILITILILLCDLLAEIVILYNTVPPSRPPYTNSSPYQQQGSPTTTTSSAAPSQQINSQPTSQYYDYLPQQHNEANLPNSSSLSNSVNG